MILQETGSPPGKSLKLSQLCGPGSAICDAGWPTPDCPWSMSVCRSQKKYFRNFNFNFNYRELLSKSATFSLRGFGVVLVHKLASSYIRYDYKLLRCWCWCCCCLDQNHPHLHRQRQPKKKILTVPTLQHDSALRDYKQNPTRNYGVLFILGLVAEATDSGL